MTIKPDSNEIFHYDSIASAFLGIAGTILALMVGFTPILKAQHVLVGLASVYLVITAILLALVLFMNIYGLTLYFNVKRKKRLIILSSIPLSLAFSVIIYDMLVYIV